MGGGQANQALDVKPYAVTYDADVSDNAAHSALLAWWNARRGERAAALRNALDPLDLRAHMGSLVLIQCLPDLADFRHRLIGTSIAEAYGRDSSGQSVCELYAYDPTYRDFLLELYRTVATQQVSARGFGDLRTVGRDYRHFDTYLLPLAREDGSTGWLLNQVLFS